MKMIAVDVKRSNVVTQHPGSNPVNESKVQIHGTATIPIRERRPKKSGINAIRVGKMIGDMIVGAEVAKIHSED